MKELGLALLFVGHSAFAATNGYDLKMALSMNGKLTSSSHIVVKAGETATIDPKEGTEQNFIEVVATEGEGQTKSGILMKFAVGYIGKSGKRTIVSRPQILAMENEPASITVGQKGKPEISLSVVAKRTSL